MVSRDAKELIRSVWRPCHVKDVGTVTFSSFVRKQKSARLDAEVCEGENRRTQVTAERTGIDRVGQTVAQDGTLRFSSVAAQLSFNSWTPDADPARARSVSVAQGETLPPDRRE